MIIKSWLIIGADRCSATVWKRECVIVPLMALSNSGIRISQRCVIPRLQSATVFLRATNESRLAVLLVLEYDPATLQIHPTGKESLKMHVCIE